MCKLSCCKQGLTAMIRAKRQVRQGYFENHATLFLYYSSLQSLKHFTYSPTARPLSLPAPLDLDGPAFGLAVGEQHLRRTPCCLLLLPHQRLFGQSPKAQRKASGISQGIWPSEVSDLLLPSTWAFRNKPWK